MATEPHLANPDQNRSFSNGILFGEPREDLVFPVPALRNSDRQSLRPIPDAPRQPCNRHPHGGRPALAHASEIERAGGVDGAAAELDCARVFSPAARRRARRNIRAPRTNQDDRLTPIAERALENADLAPPSPLMLLAR